LKTTLRQQLRTQLKTLSKQEKKTKSQLIQQQLYALTKHDSTFFLYRSCGNEVQTHGLFQMIQQPIFAPVTQANASMHWLQVTNHTQWQQGVFPILEPMSGKRWLPPSKPITMICPLLGFDRQGHRLGQGLGCYDRWLAQYKTCIHRLIGLAFACQEVESLPHESHDHNLDILITEREVIQF